MSKYSVNVFLLALIDSQKSGNYVNPLDSTLIGKNKTKNMASILSRGINWLRRLSDLSHHSIVLGASAASVPVIQTLPPACNTALCLTAVATQLGAQVSLLIS